MKTLKACSLLALALLTPVFGADAQKKPAETAHPKKSMARQEAKPAPKTSIGAVRKGLDQFSDEHLREVMASTRKRLAENTKKHEASHTDWVKAKKEAMAIEDEIAKHKKALADLDRKAGATAKRIKELEGAHAATEETEKALEQTLASQEKELAKRGEIRKLEEQAAKLKAQAEALEKRAAELK